MRSEGPQAFREILKYRARLTYDKRTPEGAVYEIPNPDIRKKTRNLYIRASGAMKLCLKYKTNVLRG
jgi:hypothetical protein